jgi:urease
MVPATSVTFVSQASIDSGLVKSYGLRKRVEPVKNCRNISKKDMKYNDVMPKMKVDPERYVSTSFVPRFKLREKTVEADCELCQAEPAETLPLTQAYFVY